jgi:hypothetical protein
LSFIKLGASQHNRRVNVVSAPLPIFWLEANATAISTG